MAHRRMGYTIIGNPLNFVDLLGLAAIDVIKIGGKEHVDFVAALGALGVERRAKGGANDT